MKSVEEYAEWVKEKPKKRVMVVPGIHQANNIIYQGLVEPEQIIDIISLSRYDYPELWDKELAFFNYPLCLTFVINNKVANIVDLEGEA